MNILIADDIALNRKLLRAMHEAEGHTTLEAADGIEALQILAHDKMDAVVSDILMPRMDGYRLCHEIRTNERLRDLPIVIYTSTYTSVSDEKLALDLGAGATVDAETVEALTAASAQRKAWSLADALVAGDTAAATSALLQVRAQGERLPGLIWWMSSRLREAHRVAQGLEQGASPAQLKRTLRMPSKAADQLIADATRFGADRLRTAIEEIADLELSSRGGGRGGAGEDTQALLAILRIAA